MKRPVHPRVLQLRPVSLWLLPLALMAPDAFGSPTIDSGRPLRVYLDCQTWCYDDYLRSEVDFVDYVRDTVQADVHVQVTRQSTSGGGRQYTLALTGRGDFAETTHSVRHLSPADDTDLGRRDGLAEALRLALVPFVTQTPDSELLRVVVEPRERPAGAPGRDPWNSWVLTVRGSADLEQEETQREVSVSGRLGADRVTENWKISLGAWGWRQEDRFEVDGLEEPDVVSLRTSASLRGLVVKSLGDHLGLGGWAWTSSSSFDNEALEVGVAPGLEYNVFPYSDYVRRELRALFRVQVLRVRWDEQTIFGVTEEVLVRPRLSLNFEQRERWGSLDVEAEFSAFLHQPSLNRVRGQIEASLRLTRGLSLRVDLGAARIRDQIGLPARDATPEEILLRQRQLASSYSFDARVGLSYSFGSIFNNVVNPRFGD